MRAKKSRNRGRLPTVFTTKSSFASSSTSMVHPPSVGPPFYPRRKEGGSIMATRSAKNGTVSPQAQAFLRTLQDPALMPAFPEPDNLAGWEKVRAFAEADGKAKSAPLLQRYEHTVTEGRLGGVPVLDVRPKNWKDNGKVTVYTHGGAHVMYSAASTLGRDVVFAHAT